MKTKLILAGLALIAGVNNSQAQDWYQIGSGTDKKLNTIDFPSSAVGYIGGNDSLLLKTIDGGQNWSTVNYTGIDFLPGGEHIINLQFISENVGFATVGPYSGTFKTVDGGLTWNPIPNLVTCFNHGLFFFDELNGFVGGSGCFQGEMMNKISNGIISQATINTATWDAQNLIVDIDFIDQNTGLAASRSGYILRTTDGGDNWDTIPTPGTEMNPLTSVLFVNSTLAFAGYESLNKGFGLYISTDGGLSWEEDFNSATFLYPDFLALHLTGNGTIYSGGNSSSLTSGVIFDSPDDGVTWSYSIVDEPINDISSYNDTIVFGIGDNGYIVVNQNWESAGLINFQDITASIELYPNPVSSTLNLEMKESFNLENSIVRIMSMNGESILELQFQDSIDLQKLTPGMFLLQIETPSGIITKKIIKE